MAVRKRRSDRSGRGALPSPGRPCVARREHHRQFWAAIAAGCSSEDAAVGAGVSPAVGARWFRRAGGMPPSHLAPSAKPLSGRYLSVAEREEIAIWRAQRHGVREIARRLKRAPSTISRELRRNAATRSGGLAYRATTAQWHADRSARRPKPAKLAINEPLRRYVQDRLAGVIIAPNGAAVRGPVVPWKGRRHGRRQDRRWATAWSPEQIARRLRLDFPEDETLRISHEAIYQALYVQGRGALRRELTACLRTGRALRVPRARSRGRGKSCIAPEILISQRPAEAADRAVPGHWEGDLIVGLGSSAIGTLVERTTRFTILLHLPRMVGHGDGPRTKNGPALAGHGAEAVRDAITRAIITLPEQLRRSLTWDQGAAMAQHAQLRIEAGVQVYFCDPHSPWQRGTNENTNGLLRQYFPKGMCGRPLRCKKNLWTAAALDRVLPCVRPLLRRLTGRGPVWEFVDQVHITEARSKRSPFAWFS
jgi:IS30 family transposase